MNHLAQVTAILCLSCLLGSCGLLGRMLESPTRLLQSAGRTISSTDEAKQAPATLDAPATAAVALRVTKAE